MRARLTHPFLCIPLAFLFIFLGVSCCCWLEMDVFASETPMAMTHQAKDEGCCSREPVRDAETNDKCYCRWQLSSILTKKSAATLVPAFARPMMTASRKIKPAGFKTKPADFSPNILKDSGPPLFILHSVYRL